MRDALTPTWIRAGLGLFAAGATFLIGLSAVGTLDGTVDEAGIAAGARTITLIALLAGLIGVTVHAAVERAQTGRVESIARQFGTRTIVLIPFAIAINIVLGQTVASVLKLPIYLDSVGTILVGVLAGPIAGAATGVLSNLAWTFLLAGTPFGSPYAWPFAVVAGEIGFVAGLVGHVGLLRSRPQTPLPTLGLAVAGSLAALAALAFFVVLPFYRGLCAATEGAESSLCSPVLVPGGASAPMFAILGWIALALLVLAVIGFVVRLGRDRDIGALFALVAGAACGVISALIAAPIATLVFGGVTGGGTDVLVLAFLQAGSDLQTAVVQQSLLSDSIDKALTYVLVFVLLASSSQRIVARFPQGARIVRTVEA